MQAALPEVRWLWNDALAQPHLERQLRWMDSQGIRSLVIWPWAGLTIPYLSVEYAACLDAVCSVAASLGATLWLADDLNWPSGTAAGALLCQTPDFAQRALACTSRWVVGEAPQSVLWRGEGERLFLAAALGPGGARRDLARMLEARGHPVEERRVARFGGHRSTWTAALWDAELQLPAGEWFVAIAAVVRTQPLLASALGTPWSSALPGTLDALSPGATNAFLEAVYGHFAQALDRWLGSVIAGFVTVPPPPLLAHDVTVPDGWRLDVLPWTPGLDQSWPEGGAVGLQRALPYLLARQYDARASTDPLGPLTSLALERYQEAHASSLASWCHERGLGLLSLTPDDLPAVPLSLRADRKRALSPAGLVPLTLATTPSPFTPAVDQSAVDDAWQPLDGVLPEWTWRPLSLNVHPLDGWTRRPGARGERLRLQASFDADYLPSDLCLVFEAGTVEEVALNGTALDLSLAFPPSEHEIERPDECARALPLAGHPAVVAGHNVVEIVVHIPPAERISFPLPEGVREADLLGPVYIAGSFSLRDDGATRSLVRPPHLVPLGPWAAFGYPRFAGTAVYRQALVAPDVGGCAVRLVAEAGDDVVSVSVGGEPFHPPQPSPYALDLPRALRPGVNDLTVAVTSGLAPRIAGLPTAGLRSVRLEQHARSAADRY